MISCFDHEIAIDVKESKKRRDINTGFLHRVRYNRNRPVIDQYEDILEHFFIKSDEWIYEKEHRVILPLFDADTIVVHECHLDILYDATKQGMNIKFQEMEDDMYLLHIDDILMEDMLHFFPEAMPYKENKSKNEFKSLSDFWKDSTYSQNLREIFKDPRTVFYIKYHHKR